ncbi:MAG: glycerol-3-phosphate 1-O-acyltransferase PlsY [Acidobacteriaceae bacterium]
MIETYVIAAALAYLLGSIPFGYVLVRLFRNEDIRSTGSGNIGATNVIRSGAKWLGIATLLLDASKGYAAVVLAGHLARNTAHPLDAVALAAAFATIGHIFPVWLGFKGGKGVATALGVFLAFIPLAALSVLGVFLAVFLVSRYVSLASVLAAASFPVFGYYFTATVRTPIVIACMLFVPALIIFKHRQNIQRLLNGSEYRFGNKKKTQSEQSA